MRRSPLKPTFAGSRSRMWVAVALAATVALGTAADLAPATTYVTAWGSYGSSHDPPRFYWPSGVAVDAHGHFFVADMKNHRIEKFSHDGTWEASWGEVGGPLAGQFYEPMGVAVDADGNIYATDTFRHRMIKIMPDGQWKFWGGYGTDHYHFYYPGAVAVAHGRLYVADTNNQRILVYDTTDHDRYVTTWGTVGIVGAAHGEFSHPRGVAAGADGHVYVADTGNNRIQEFIDGHFERAWGAWEIGTKDEGHFNQPYGIAVDAHGHVYVADTDNNRIEKFTSSGGFITAWGMKGFAPGDFHHPQGVAVDAHNNVYVADLGNNRIQKFSQP